MKLVMETGANWRRENLLISNEVALIVLNKYEGACFRDILLTERNGNGQIPTYQHISATHAAYMPLHYVLLFIRGERGWN